MGYPVRDVISDRKVCAPQETLFESLFDIDISDLGLLGDSKQFSCVFALYLVCVREGRSARLAASDSFLYELG